MKNSRTLSLADAASVALSLVACAEMKMTPAGPVADTKIMNPDTALADRVHDELKAKSELGGAALKITAKNGEVTLKGDLKTGQQLAKIAMFVQDLPGVTAVIPDINVKP